jgi:CubicO group peptidase (beta-lactamase class C family)
MTAPRLLCLVLLALAAAPSVAGEFKVADPQAAGFDAEKLAAIATTMQKHIDDGTLVGGAGLVARGDKIIYAETWGQRDREQQLPIADDTIYRIYSMSKAITSVAAMLLVERGKLGLDDPISKHLPQLAEMTVLVKNDGQELVEVPADREITVRDLLRHTSGFTYGFFGNSEVDKRYRRAGVLMTDRTLKDTISKLSKIPLKNQPGTQWHYSVSTDVLGRVVEVASGQSFDQFLHDEIFEPLGMQDTFFNVPKEKQPRLAQMYVPDENGGLKPAGAGQSYRFVTPSNRFYSGGGGLCSTVRDYLAFCQMLLGEGKSGDVRLLKPETVRSMHTNQLGDAAGRSAGFQFGLGFSIDGQGHYSWGGAAGTRFWIDPKNKLITIYMTQIKPTGKFSYGGQMKKLVYDAIK